MWPCRAKHAFALFISLCIGAEAFRTSGLLHSGGYTASRQILQPLPRTAEYLDSTLNNIVTGQTATKAAVVVLPGPTAPSRRTTEQVLLTFAPEAAAAIPVAVRRALQSAMQQVETMRGRHLFPITIDVMPSEHSLQSESFGAVTPWAVYEVSSGRVLLRRQLLQLLASTPTQAMAVFANACFSSMQQVVEQVKQVAQPTNREQLTSLLDKAFATGIAVAFAAAVPKWFCFACPIMLGLLAPLVINAGVGEAADMACKAMDLSDNECVDLWFTALALGMILSLLSAIPIYKVCRLHECAHPNGTALAVE